MAYKNVLRLALISWWPICQLAEAADKGADANRVIEIWFKAEKPHVDPFNDVILDLYESPWCKGERSLAQQQMIKSLFEYAGGDKCNPA
jgi:hypothetical protein